MERSFIHDPAIYKDETTGKYYIYSTGGMGFESEDLIKWTPLGKIAEVLPEAKEWTGGNDIWAPDIVKVGDEYRLYCSNSTWGVRQSCIFLAVSDKACGPFVPKAAVLKTSDRLPVNGIDANIISDVETGEMYMLYGSFWGGTYILKLDKETGLAAEEGIGVCVASRPEWHTTAVEGPYMIYKKENGYYYLFVSYGSLTADYNIRVGRSKSITGPFLDINGKSLTEKPDGPGDSGYLLFGGYTWNEGKPYMAPGHNSVLFDDDADYIVYHIREKRFNRDPGVSDLQIRQIFWTEDGWPVASAYTVKEAGGHMTANNKATMLEIAGEYERINFVPALPQGISTAVPMKLSADGYFESCSIRGTWETDGEHITIKYGPYVERCVFYEKNELKGLSGISDKGIQFVAQRIRKGGVV